MFLQDTCAREKLNFTLIFHKSLHTEYLPILQILDNIRNQIKPLRVLSILPCALNVSIMQTNGTHQYTCLKVIIQNAHRYHLFNTREALSSNLTLDIQYR